MYINQFSLVVFKRQHYVFHIFTGCSLVRHFPVLQIKRPPVCVRVVWSKCALRADIPAHLSELSSQLHLSSPKTVSCYIHTKHGSTQSTHPSSV